MALLGPGRRSAYSIRDAFEVWYDFPSLRKEAVMTVAFSFVDNEGTTFHKSVDIRVSP